MEPFSIFYSLVLDQWCPTDPHEGSRVILHLREGLVPTRGGGPDLAPALLPQEEVRPPPLPLHPAHTPVLATYQPEGRGLKSQIFRSDKKIKRSAKQAPTCIPECHISPPWRASSTPPPPPWPGQGRGTPPPPPYPGVQEMGVKFSGN